MKEKEREERLKEVMDAENISTTHLVRAAQTTKNGREGSNPPANSKNNKDLLHMLIKKSLIRVTDGLRLLFLIKHTGYQTHSYFLLNYTLLVFDIIELAGDDPVYSEDVEQMLFVLDEFLDVDQEEARLMVVQLLEAENE
jgi:hypothetical protein